MLDNIFLQILNMSFTASFVILVVIAVRPFLKKAPKMVLYSLWSVVLFRLVCPFSFESAFGFLGTKPIPQNIAMMPTPQINTGFPAINDSVNAILPAATPAASMNPMQAVVAIGEFVWLCGIFVLAIYSVFSLLRLKYKLRDATLMRENIYLCEGLSSPFVLGLSRPKIYLPETLSDSEMQYILLHEQTHIRHFDHVIKLVSFGALCLHWFNPLAWIAFFLCGRDMEMACDESVIKKLGGEVKRDYSSSLLTLATGRRIVGGSPLAFGEGDTKTRIKNVLHYKKPAFWAVCVTIAAVVILVALLAANPLKNSDEEEIASATQALLERNSSYTKIEQAQVYDSAVLLLASAPSPEMPEVNIGYGVFVMEKIDGDYTISATDESEPAMSLGFASSILKWRDLTIVFGDLGDRYWNFRTDEVTQADYTKVRVLYEGAEQSVTANSNSAYVVVIEDNVQVTDIEFYDGDALVTSYAANYAGSLTSILARDLTAEEITQVNDAFKQLLPVEAGDNVTATAPDGSKFKTNPIVHFFSSFYKTTSQIDMDEFVNYIPRESYLTAADAAEFEALQKASDWLPFKSMDDPAVPFGRISFNTVDNLFKQYTSIALADVESMGSAIYSDKYGCFYSYASDYGPGHFICERGKVDGDTATLYSADAVLTLRKSGRTYDIVSHVPAE